ncbi:MAG: DUF5606 domain-containing protein [Sphingomonadales bacterium]|jgi:hypothetical protein
MELKDIVSVSGVPGLHKIIGRNKTGLIVETIGTGKKFATTLQQRVSVLADIAMFTDEGETKLWQVLQLLKALDESGSNPPASNADNDEIKAYMGIVLPNYDREKVYPGDMKKLFSWYGIIKGLLDWSKLGQEEEESTEETGSTDKPAEKTAGKAAAPKKVKTSAPKPTGGVKAKTTTPRKMGS